MNIFLAFPGSNKGCAYKCDSINLSVCTSAYSLGAIFAHKATPQLERLLPEKEPYYFFSFVQHIYLLNVELPYHCILDGRNIAASL